MAVSLAQFLIDYPEFSDSRAPVDLIESRLAQAARRVDPEVWGNVTNDGVMLYAAHLISTSPWGQQAQLSADDGSTTYQKTFDELEITVSGGPLVT